MISNKIYGILKCRKPISEKMEKEIFNKGIITGSLKFGDFNDKSDTDIILNDTEFSIRQFEDICAYNQDYNEFDEFTSLYIKNKKGIILNLLIMHGKKQFNIWKKTTYLMIKLNKIPILKKAFKNKNIRVKMFELLKELFE